MSHYGILRDVAVTQTGEDIRGSHLYGVNDEKLGKIDDVIFNHLPVTSAMLWSIPVDG